MIEVIGLHYHIVEFKEGETLLHSLLIALSGKHTVNGEASSNVTEHLDIVKSHKPICVVYHYRLSLGKVDKSAHLLLEALAVMLNGLRGHHLAHIGSSRGVTDHSRSTADKGNGLVSCHLQTLHKAERHKVSNVKAVRRGVKAYIEYSFTVIYKLLDLFFIGYLRNKSTGNQLIVNSHDSSEYNKYLINIL